MTSIVPLPLARQIARLPAVDPRRVLPWLLLLLFVLNVPQAWYLRLPLVALFVAAVLVRRWLYTPAFWYAAATLLGTTVYLNWESSDNHRYLFVYAALSLCCAFSLPRAQQGETLALASRWLIGLCMLLAAAWKLANPQYLDGSFFSYELLADERFVYVAAWLGNVPLTDLQANRELRDLLLAGHLRGFDIRSVALSGSESVAPLAVALTWWTLLIEAALATLFLLPDRRCSESHGPAAPSQPGCCYLATALPRARNMLLLVFVVSTYAIAPVHGFGWILLLLGLAQTTNRDRAFRPAYLAAFLLVEVYLLPIAGIVELIAGC